MGNGCGLQMDGLSGHFEEYESISNDFVDLGHLGVVSGALTLFPEGPRILRKCPKGPGTLSAGPGILREGAMVVWCCFRKASGPSDRVLRVLGPCSSVLPNWSGLVATCRNLSELVWPCLALSGLLWP